MCLEMQRTFGVSSLEIPVNRVMSPDLKKKLASAIYLQVSIVSQALIFVTRSRSWSFIERPGLLLMGAFLIAQLVSQLSPWILHTVYLFLSSQYYFLADCDSDRGLCKLELC